MNKNLVTSESVCMGHPDKICDRIADSILDEILKNDAFARVACEAVCTTGMVMVFGEISTSCYVEISKIVRESLKYIGYDGVNCGFDANTCAVLCNIDEQSFDIAKGIFKLHGDKLNRLKAGDQGIVFGYACNETDEYMPLPIVLAHKLAKKLDEARKFGLISYLKPDGKTEVSVSYDASGPKAVETVVVSCQHEDGVSSKQIEKDIVETIILPSINHNLLTKNTKFYVNPGGRFVVGGPVADSGLTGRKIMVDSYGGISRHGGGAFSGKDPTKIDRSGAYFARYVAKNVVASGLCNRCEVGLAYVIGKANPISVSINSFGTAKVPDYILKKAILNIFDFRPAAIIERLNLCRPIYSKLSTYGHFGRNDVFCSWEQQDAVEELKSFVKGCKIC